MGRECFINGLVYSYLENLFVSLGIVVFKEVYWFFVEGIGISVLVLYNYVLFWENKLFKIYVNKI